MRKCTNCGEELDLGQFRPRSTRPGKFQTWCRQCENARNRKRSRASPLGRYVHRARNLYGAALSMVEMRAEVGEPEECYLCGCGLDDTKWQMDHVIPTSRGGATSPSNLRWACVTCNQMKHNLTLDELREHMLRVLERMASAEARGWER